MLARGLAVGIGRLHVGCGRVIGWARMTRTDAATVRVVIGQ